MPVRHRICAILSLVFAVSSASAEVYLNESQVWRRAKLIAPGQQVWSFETAYQNYANRFGTSGAVHPLGDRYTRAVTWKQLLQGSAEGKAEIEGLMRQHHLSENDVAATATYNLQRAETGMAVDWAYGLTPRWMIGFQVPLIYRKTTVHTTVDFTPALAETAGKPSQQSVLGLSKEKLRAKVAGMASEELGNSGYDAIPDQKTSLDWGDISLLSQFSVMESYRLTWSLQEMVRVPTSRNPSLADYLQSGGDDGNVDVGLTSLVDYRVKRWVTGFRLGYVAQLPDSVRIRTSLSRYQIDPNVHRDLGDWMWGAVDTEYRLTTRLGLNVEYAFLSKSQDRYSGESVEGEQYATLGKDTDQELHQTRLGFAYRLGERSVRSGVENKWVASLGYTYPWIGRNSADASRTSLELISYF